MKIVLLGRTQWLLDAGRSLRERGHDIVTVITARAESFYGVDEQNFQQFAERAGAAFHKRLRLNSAAGAEILRASGADIAVSVNWPTIVREGACRALPRGILNAHAGDLPRYRGNACPNWAILNGESHVGLCVHEMEPAELDSGPIVCRDRFPLGQDTYIGDVYAWLDRRIPELLVEAVEQLEHGRIAPESQPTDKSLALRCYPRRPQDSRISWSNSAPTVYRLIRASSRPFSGAFTTLEGTRRVTIWKAKPYVHPEPFCAVPGQVMLRADGDPVIACGSGCLRLTEIEVEGIEESEKGKTEVVRSLRARLI